MVTQSDGHENCKFRASELFIVYRAASRQQLEDFQLGIIMISLAKFVSALLLFYDNRMASNWVLPGQICRRSSAFIKLYRLDAARDRHGI